MIYFVLPYVPDGPVTKALKRRVKGRRPKPALGNLGPLLDENLTAARKHGNLLYHPDDLRLLKGVTDNPEVVDEGFDVLREVMAEKGIAEPTSFDRTPPWYHDVPRLLRWSALLAVAMTAAIWIAVVLGQDDAIVAMTVAICVVSVLGAAAFIWILDRAVVRVGPGMSG